MAAQKRREKTAVVKPLQLEKPRFSSNRRTNVLSGYGKHIALLANASLTDYTDEHLQWNPLAGEWKEFHDEWRGTSTAETTWSIRQPQVRRALGMCDDKALVFDRDLYDRVCAATPYACAGIVIDSGVGIDGSTLRAFFLHHIITRKPCYFTAYSLDTYMVDEEGVSQFPTDTFKPYHPHLPVIDDVVLPWSFIDLLPKEVYSASHPDYPCERRYPPYVADSHRTFALILADPQIKGQYRGWVKRVQGSRWTRPEDTFMYTDLALKPSRQWPWDN
ncbi:hypothetical protein B0H19DRAFT_1368230 [Mycena capillaripes]|nr:hypothetical protein B0H19DRAFT_1368230 [Mycena capillaripes]